MEIAKPEWLEQMEVVLETLNAGVLISDDCDHVLFVNSVFEEMTGIARTDILGRDPLELYTPEDRLVLEELRRKTRQMGRSTDEFYVPTRAGRRLPVVASARSIEDPDGRLFTIVSLIDISEQKAVEARLRTVNVEVEKRQKEVEEDLALAARVQQSLAPKSMLWGYIRVEAFYRPVRTIGGDFGLVSPIDEDHLNVMVCDVSGHGISSALVANRIYSETISQLSSSVPIGDMLRRLNHLVIQSIGNPLFFFTISIAQVDRTGKRMIYAGAGHPPAMIVTPGREPHLLESRSTLLGVFPDAVDAKPEQEVLLEAGDRIVLYTDGITDVFDSERRMLGVAGVQRLVRETATMPLADMKRLILERVEEWRGGGPPTDDLSLILIEV
jgi:sigma-B regulation protein RsbU (phosphoserine phosphatase)